jgi:tight adherence protein B
MMQDLISVGLLATIVLLIFIAVMVLVSTSGIWIQNVSKFYKQKFTKTTDNQLADMFVFTDMSHLFLVNVLAIILIPALVHYWFQLWVVTWSALGVIFVIPGMVWASLRKKRLAKFEEQLPDAFVMLSSSLQSGASLNMALETVAAQSPVPLSQEFGLIVKRMRLGVTLDDALIELEKRLPMQSFIMASSAIRISREVGGNLVETINSMSKTLRRKKMMEGKIESLTAQGRAQGIFMAMLPVILAGLLSVIEPEAMTKLYTTKEGLVVLFIMVSMQILGYVFIRKVTSIDT